MTRKRLEDYPHICAELEDVERKLHEPIIDTVSGSGSEFPYTQHTVTIQGVDPDLLAQRNKLLAQKEEIENFIRSLPNSKLRRIVDYRVIQGMSWEEVAAKIGHWVSVYSVKRDYYKLFKKMK